MKILETCVYSPSIVKLFVYDTVKCEVIMSNFSVEIFLWTILQLWLNENVWNYYIHQKECVVLTVNQKIDTFEIFNSWNTLYIFSIFSWYFSFTDTEHSFQGLS